MGRGDDPAFGGKFDHPQQGLTVREYFAIKIMAGMLADPGVEDEFNASTWAVRAADTLLAALEKPKAEPDPDGGRQNGT